MNPPLNRFDTEEVWSVLVALQNFLRESPDEQSHFYILDSDWENAEFKKDILTSLSDLGVIKNIKYSESPFSGASFEISPKRLDPICQEYKKEILLARKKNQIVSRPNENAVIVINSKYGVSIESELDAVYDIGGARRNFLFYLAKQNGTGISAQELIPQFWKDTSMVAKEIKGINSAFKKALSLNKDLIINSQTAGGYILNEKDYQIRILDNLAH